MFIFDDEVKDENRKQVYDHPLGGKVRFMKYGEKIIYKDGQSKTKKVEINGKEHAAGILYVNVKDYFEPYHDDKVEKIKKLIPVEWHNNLGDVWMDVEAFNKASENLSKKELKAIGESGEKGKAAGQDLKEKIMENKENGRKNNRKNTKRGKRKNKKRRIRKS